MSAENAYPGNMARARRVSGRNISNAERGTKLRGVRMPPELDARIQAWIARDPKNRTLADVFAAGIEVCEAREK